MDNNKSFVENLSFMEKSNEYQDSQSIYNQNYLVGGYPIDKIPNISKNAQNDLKNYGIPAGLVTISKNNDLVIGGGYNINKIKKSLDSSIVSETNSLPNTIQDFLYENLLDKVIHNKNKTKNKTIKITK